MRFLDGVESDRALRWPAALGRTLPAYATSLSAEELRALCPEEKFIDRPTDETVEKLSDLEAQLDKVRLQGYATNSSASEDGVSRSVSRSSTPCGDRSPR